MDELKPCPCCNGEAVISEQYSFRKSKKEFTGFSIRCKSRPSCVRQGKIYRIKEKAIQAWNNRAENTKEKIMECNIYIPIPNEVSYE